MSLRRLRTIEGSAFAQIPSEALERLVAIGEDTADLDARVELSQRIRRELGEAGVELDRFLLRRICGLGEAFEEIKEAQAELRGLLERYQLGPWYPAVFLSLVATTDAPRALVMQGSARRVVGLAREVEAASLVSGEEVYLDDAQGLVVAKSALGLPRSADTAAFERRLSDGRLLLRWRDELVVVESAGAIGPDALAPGDLVRWDRGIGMAFERLEQQADQRFMVEDVPDLGRDRVGGQDENLRRLLDALTSTLVDPERARRYGLGGRQSILMVGPPGGGKTLMARVAAAEVDRLTGKRCRLAVVKPAEWESPWVGESQRNIRECFKALREAASDGFGILFLDEVEAVGRIRGGAVGHHDDKFLAALLAEIDGFASCSGIAIIAATNRKDLVDPALLERLSDVELHIGRPDMAGARRIFEIHLPEDLPYAGARFGAGSSRSALVDLAVSRLYSPNGDNELCALRFRDGTARTIASRELVSGRLIEQICRTARAAAFQRDVRGGEAGLSAVDLEDAVTWAVEKLASTLTPRNCRSYLPDLPQDVDVVRVDPVVRRVPRSHDYLNAA